MFVKEGLERHDRTYLFEKRSAASVQGTPVSGYLFGTDRLQIIAGPCSVESAGQIDETAAFIRECGLHFLRGGAFKPRTSPYSFQGLGLAGVELLAVTAEKYGLKIITEVMEPGQVSVITGYADILQVGARNMQNTALLKELAATAKPVLLKRGFANTIEELLLSAEYILSGGNNKVILCERGIRTFEPSTRFSMDITTAAAVKGISHLPVIADPSHAAGRAALVPPVAKAAIAAGFDGLMLEIHPDPAIAKSDAGQALCFSDFRRLLNELQQIAPACGKTIDFTQNNMDL